MRKTVTQRLIQDHHNIERVLMLMRMQLDFLREADGKGLTLLTNAANYLIHYPGLLHHPLEELMFERVVANEASVECILAQLRREHAALAADAGELVARIGLQQMRGGEGREELRSTGSKYVLSYDRHMRYEEKEVFPLAGDFLSAKQWEEIGAKLVYNKDPLFSPESLALYDNLFDALMGEAARLDG